MKHGLKLIRATFFLSGALILSGCSSQYGQITHYSDKSDSKTITPSGSIASSDLAESNNNTSQGVYVSITGAVKNPGVYIMPVGSRIYDVINAAGGIDGDEEISEINLVYIIEDGMQIHIGRKDAGNNDVIDAETSLSGKSNSSEDTLNTNGKVNINTATKEGLLKLTGIGETRAEAIIAYREAHGKFYAIDEIMNVTGIKEGTYNKIKDMITVK